MNQLIGGYGYTTARTKSNYDVGGAESVLQELINENA